MDWKNLKYHDRNEAIQRLLVDAFCDGTAPLTASELAEKLNTAPQTIGRHISGNEHTLNIRQTLKDVYVAPRDYPMFGTDKPRKAWAPNDQLLRETINRLRKGLANASARLMEERGDNDTTKQNIIGG